MSTNPFRRENSRPSAPNSSLTDAYDISNDVANFRSPELSVNTKVPPGSTDRHVSFASPPVDSTIPAVEYPSSPESTRFSPAFQFAKPVNPAATDYSTAVQSDPFRAEELKDEDDGVIGEALQNAQANAVLTEGRETDTYEDAVKNTLSRFASAPRKGSRSGNKSIDASSDITSSRQTMDVDAFKRLLLTGNSGQTTPKGTSGSKTNQTSAFTSDSSSSADTASLSQQSIFEPAVVTEETPRSSHEFDAADLGIGRDQRQNDTMELKKKAGPPPAPTPRRTKSIRHNQPDIEPGPSRPEQSSRDKLQPQPNLILTEQSENPKRPPTPPLSRRQSHKAGLVRSEVHRPSSSIDPEVESITSVSSGRAPPPPPSRRRESGSGWSSMDLAPTVEESDSPQESIPLGRKSSGVRPPPPPARNSSSSAKRASLGMMSPPPLPPPRRGRGSSRSSIDSHRPSMSAIMGDVDSARNSGEFVRPSNDSRRISNPSNANNILADLATLQRELEEARQRNR